MSEEAVKIKSLHEVEIEHILKVLNLGKSLEDVAKILNIHPTTLYRKRQAFDIVMKNGVWGISGYEP